MPYPRSLKPPSAQGYSLESPDSLLRSEMDGGLARTRLRNRQATRKVTMQWVLQELDAATLAAWLNESGHAWQTMPLYTPQGTVTCNARRVGTWSTTNESTWWHISATFETLPVAPVSNFEAMSKEHYRVEAAYGFATLDAAATARRWAAGHYPASHYF